MATQLDVGSAPLADRDRPARFEWSAALVATAPAWVVARVVALLLQSLVQSTGQHPQAQFPDGKLITGPMSQLLSWDSSWYLGLAERGYAPYGPTGVRFSPLLPLVTRGVSALGVPAAAAILLICWLAAFLFGLAVYRLALDLTGDRSTASRAAWLSQLAPGAFALVMGYSEAMAGLFSALFLIAVLRPVDGSRATRYWLGAGFAAGMLAGLDRPVGLLLALPGLIELVRRRRAPIGERLARLAVAISPLLGVSCYLLWCQRVYGKFMLPYSVQSTPGLHGGLATDPFQTAWHLLNASTANGTQMLTVILAVIGVALLWVCARRLPVSLTVWAAMMVLSGLTAVQMAGYARYASAAIPLLIAAAMIAKDRRAWGWMLAASVFMFAYFCYAAFTGWYVP